LAELKETSSKEAKGKAGIMSKDITSLPCSDAEVSPASLYEYFVN
jgi:hypothetical protein